MNFYTRRMRRNLTKIQKMDPGVNHLSRMWDKLTLTVHKLSTQVDQLKQTCTKRAKGQWRQMIIVKKEIHSLNWPKASNQCLTKNSLRILSLLELSENIFWKGSSKFQKFRVFK